jgi:hypothetical protein
MKSPRRRAWLVFLLLYAGAQALLWWLYWWPTPKTLVGDESLYLARALGVAGLGPVPEKLWLWPPLQHWFIAAIFRVFGPSLVAVQIAQNLLLLGAAFFLRDLWRRCDGRVRAGNLAAALFLLNPSTLAYAWWLWPEPLHLFLLLGSLWLLVCAPEPLATAPLRQTLAAALAGAAVGLAILTKSLLAPFWPLFALLWWRGAQTQHGTAPAAGYMSIWAQARAWLRAGGMPAWRRSAAFALALALVTAPVLFDGWRKTGAPLIADSSGFNLVGGLEDRWRSDYIEDSVAQVSARYAALPGTPQQKNAAMLAEAKRDIVEHGLFATLGEQLGKQYFRLLSAKTLLVSQLPGRTCEGRVAAYHLDPGWAVDGLAQLSLFWHVALLALGALGIAAWRRWREPLIWWIALFTAYQLALFLGLHVKARFLLPLLPFLGGFAASALLSLRQVGGAAAGDTPLRWTRPRLALAIGLSALLTFLAIGGPWLDHSCA